MAQYRSTWPEQPKKSEAEIAKEKAAAKQEADEKKIADAKEKKATDAKAAAKAEKPEPKKEEKKEPPRRNRVTVLRDLVEDLESERDISEEQRTAFQELNRRLTRALAS